MKSFERDVRNLIVGGLLVLFVLAGVSLIVLRNMASWGESQYRERLLAATQILADQLARAGDQAFSRDVETGRLLWDAGARSAALYDGEGRQIVGATFLTDPGLSPPHLPHGERPSPLEPLLTLSLAAPPRITVTALIPGDTRVVRVVYDGSALASARHTRDAVTILVPGAALVLVLFAFPFLQRLTRPIRALTETARDAGTVIPEARTPGPISSLREEASEAVATFARTIEVLKQRTGELDRMRQIEKERADALAVTAATLVRTHPGGLLVIDAVGRLAEANPPALHALGATRDAIGKPATAILAVEALRDAAHRAAKGEPTLGREFTLGDKAGERRFAVTAVPVVDAAQKRLGTLLFLEDRTKTNRLERELSARRELAALGEMSAGIAHEFRNATATIVGYARLAATTDDPEARARQLAGIRTEAEHVARVTGDFLFFARPGRLVAARTPLEPLVRDVVEDERTAAADVTLEVTGAFAEAPVDAGLFRRALVNLLRNAREAATAGGRNARIVVRGLGTQEGLARIAVEDDGPGVPAEDAPKLFVPFYSTKESGTGLGLALVAKIAALHGGSATVERSEALGGARFVLSFALGDER